MNLNTTKVIFLASVLLFISVCVVPTSVRAQDDEHAGWTLASDLIGPIFWYFKIEENAVKLKGERRFLRHYGNKGVFQDLILTYAYSLVPPNAKTHKWITAKVTFPKWDRAKIKDNGEPDVDLHTVDVTIPVKDGTKVGGKQKKFCWKLVDLRLADGTKLNTASEGNAKTCDPPEKDDAK